jgi:hypothetical protein
MEEQLFKEVVSQLCSYRWAVIEDYGVRDLGKVCDIIRKIDSIFACFWRDNPQWARASSFTGFLDHTQRRTRVGKTPLDELSARRRDL